MITATAASVAVAMRISEGENPRVDIFSAELEI